ncbi:universal stress protein [Aliifodinibius sp. S!AR15-10]|uniref:universal stress protein n=1 Tax=Aliifodinibius sp. S!AR15-10 TaxID=2950437 RepID=UPI002863FD11|nr:universal stress protein [Aliifodinibius sp. S!AR15-10]MDR8393925.1 universal stress protein [Aliifodinibius sp. S!AR15-10]
MVHNPNDAIKLRRILVAIDPSSHSRAALRAAAGLAKKMEAQIHGLFVQEENWHKVSRLPFVSTVNELTGDTHTLEEQYLQKQIEMLAHRLRRQLKAISHRNKISHSWRTVQGRVEDEILQAAEDADLITIGRRGISFPEKRKLGSTAKTIIRNADKPILILKKGLTLGKTITSVYDGSKESQRCIRLALALAEKNESKLTILALGNKPGAANERIKELEQQVHRAPVKVEVVMLKNPDMWGFTHSVNRRRTGLLIIPKNQPLLKHTLETVLYQINCPLLLMN